MLTRVDEARRHLGALAAEPDSRRAGAACDLGRTVSDDISHLLDDLAAESPAARAAARAAGERFDSHVLAATLLEASDASVASVFELVGRGLVRLESDIERLARTRRLPA